jgi:serine/threonine protein kinase
MFYAFSDFENLYLVTDLVTGGDLRYYLSKRKKFSEQETKFFIACIVVGLEYMHNNGVIHRDIKPENLLLDEKGYVHITDMGISRIWSPDNA